MRACVCGKHVSVGHRGPRTTFFYIFLSWYALRRRRRQQQTVDLSPDWITLCEHSALSLANAYMGRVYRRLGAHINRHSIRVHARRPISTALGANASGERLSHALRAVLKGIRCRRRRRCATHNAHVCVCGYLYETVLQNRVSYKTTDFGIWFGVQYLVRHTYNKLNEHCNIILQKSNFIAIQIKSRFHMVVIKIQKKYNRYPMHTLNPISCVLFVDLIWN